MNAYRCSIITRRRVHLPLRFCLGVACRRCQLLDLLWNASGIKKSVVLEALLWIGSLWSRHRRPRRRGGAPPPRVCGIPGTMVVGLVVLALMIVRVVCADCLYGLRTAEARRGLPVRIASADCGLQESDFQLLDGWYICIIYMYIYIYIYI